MSTRAPTYKNVLASCLDCPNPKTRPFLRLTILLSLLRGVTSEDCWTRLFRQVISLKTHSDCLLTDKQLSLANVNKRKHARKRCVSKRLTSAHAGIELRNLLSWKRITENRSTFGRLAVYLLKCFTYRLIRKNGPQALAASPLVISYQPGIASRCRTVSHRPAKIWWNLSCKWLAFRAMTTWHLWRSKMQLISYTASRP